VKRELERIEIPGEHDARERTWAVAQAAFAERQPVVHRTRRLRPALALAAMLAVVAAALSPPGRAVLDEIREVVGVERAQPALFSLPAPGQLLVASDSGIWVVRQDGSRRLLGDYREASWSPFGRFVVAARENELAALEPDGHVRWTLPRPGVRDPRWAGTESDTRIAYFDRTGLRVVAGDGTDDRVLARGATGPLAWRPGNRFVLAYAGPRSRINALDVDSQDNFWLQRPIFSFPDAKKLIWSSDGRRLLLLRRSMLVVFGTESAAPLAVRQMRNLEDAAFEPGSHRVAVSRGNEVVLLDADRLAAAPRRLFIGAGPFESLAWSGDGRWLIVGWPAADQWVFVRRDGRRTRAVANVSEQFRSESFPRIEGWCCTR
jgi:hypothetical protein